MVARCRFLGLASWLRENLGRADAAVHVRAALVPDRRGNGGPDRSRTYDLPLRRRLLYPLSYEAASLLFSCSGDVIKRLAPLPSGNGTRTIAARRSNER